MPRQEGGPPHHRKPVEFDHYIDYMIIIIIMLIITATIRNSRTLPTSCPPPPLHTHTYEHTRTHTHTVSAGFFLGSDESSFNYRTSLSVSTGHESGLENTISTFKLVFFKNKRRKQHVSRKSGE